MSARKTGKSLFRAVLFDNGFHRCPITQITGGFGEVALALEGFFIFISAVSVASYDGNGLTP